MEEKMIPYFAHEGDMSRMERANKRLWIVILVLIVALVGSNGAWIWYESQFEEEVTTKIEAEQETSEGSNYVVGGDYYGEAESQGDSN